MALKECYEAEYWIELLIDGGYYNNKEIQEKCIEIKKILISSINTAKENMK
nr:four helix bundle protein [Eubacteriales bacterium]